MILKVLILIVLYYSINDSLYNENKNNEQQKSQYSIVRPSVRIRIGPNGPSYIDLFKKIIK